MAGTAILRFFRQRHPAHDDPWGYLRTITIIGLLVFFMLWVFTPFNFQRFPENWRVLMAFLYSGSAYLTMLVCLVWIVKLPRIFKAETWTLGKELLLIVYQFTTVSFSVWLVSRYLEGVNRPYAYTWGIVAAAGILPYLVATAVKHIYQLQRNLREAVALQGSLQQHQQEPEAVLLHVPELLVPLALDECLFVRAQGNYLHIMTEKTGAIQTYIVRLPMRKFMEDNPLAALFQCHRAYVVNLTQISRVGGDAAGCYLQFREGLPTVPVSRANVAKLKQLLGKASSAA